MTSLYDGLASLNYAAKRLRLQWQNTHCDWNDMVSTAFERAYLAPLEPQLRSTLQAIECLNDILRRAETECGESK